MEQDRWQRPWSVFHGALERPEGRERAGFLTESCGSNAALRAEVDALLAAHEATEGPFPHPGVAARPIRRRRSAAGSGPTGSCAASAKAAWASSTRPSRRSRSGAAVALKADQAGHQQPRGGCGASRPSGRRWRAQRRPPASRRERWQGPARRASRASGRRRASRGRSAERAQSGCGASPPPRRRRGAPGRELEACIMPPRDPESGFARHATAAPEAERSRRMRSVRAPGNQIPDPRSIGSRLRPTPRVGGAARRPARASAATRDRRASAPCRTCAAARHAALPPAVTGFSSATAGGTLPARARSTTLRAPAAVFRGDR